MLSDHFTNNMACIADFEDLVRTVEYMPLQDQRDLAENILSNLAEKGWDVEWNRLTCSLRVTKTEVL